MYMEYHIEVWYSSVWFCFTKFTKNTTYWLIESELKDDSSCPTEALPSGPEKVSLADIHKSLLFWAFGDEEEESRGYLGSHYTDFWAFRVAEVLDCRTYKLMTVD